MERRFKRIAPWKDLSKWALICIIFFGIPLVLLCFSLNKTWQFREEAALENAFYKMDGIAFSIRRFEKTERYFAELIRRLFRKAEKHPVPLNSLKSGIARLKRRFPGVFRFSVVNAAGEPVSELCDGPPPRFVLKRLYLLFRDLQKLDRPETPKEKKDELIRSSWNVVKTFIGPLAFSEAVFGPLPAFLEVSLMDQDRWFFAQTGPAFGLFVHAHHSFDWPGLHRDDIRRMFHRRNSHSPFRIGFETEESAKIGRNYLPHQIRDGFLFSVTRLSPTSYFWVSFPQAGLPDFHARRLGMATGGTLLFCLLALLSFRSMILKKEVRIPLRLRLTALFLFAGGIPLSGIILTEWNHLNQIYRARVFEERNACEQVLRSFDAGFTRFKRGIEKRMKEFAQTHGYEGPAEKQRVHHGLKTFWKRMGRPDLMIVDRQGKIVWEAGPPDSRYTSSRGMFQQLCPAIFHSLNQEDKGDSILAGFDEGRGIDGLVQDLGKFVEVNAFGTPKIQWFYPFMNSNSRAEYILYMNWMLADTETIFIRKELLSAQRMLEGIRLFTSKRDFSDPFPVNSEFTRFLGKPLLRIFHTDRTVFDTIRVGQEHFLLTGIKPKNLGSHILIGLKSDSSVRDAIGFGRKALFVFILICAGVSTFLGLFLSDGFLLPISHLTDGVLAIDSRAFDHRVPVIATDELGSLAGLFNEALVGLQELELAKVVQEDLFPKSELRVGEFSIFGKSRMMVQIGGDFFDIIPLPDGRVLLLIGDVAGHGVPAGLIMAMVKALVMGKIHDAGAKNSPLTPDSVLAFILAILFKTIVIGRMVTCFVGILDPGKNTFEYSNAGHCYPSLYSGGKEAESLTIGVSPPLFAKRKLAFPKNSVALKPGDKIMFYTDGLMEAKTPDGSVIGYNRAFGEIRPLLTDNPVESHGKIMDWFHSITGNGEQEDDLTILLLCRVGRS